MPKAQLAPSINSNRSGRSTPSTPSALSTPSTRSTSSTLSIVSTPSTESKTCPICERDLPIDEFGTCRARKEGRNLYCKQCIREKVAKNRRAWKERKKERARLLAKYEETPEEVTISEPAPTFDFYSRKKPPVDDRVRDAIEQGARTYTEIVKAVRDRWTSDDRVGEAIAHLLLDREEIRTEVIGETRQYFLREQKPEPPPRTRPATRATPFWAIFCSP